jgi:hypothetical protein
MTNDLLERLTLAALPAAMLIVSKEANPARTTPEECAEESAKVAVRVAEATRKLLMYPGK